LLVEQLTRIVTEIHRFMDRCNKAGGGPHEVGVLNLEFGEDLVPGREQDFVGIPRDILFEGYELLQPWQMPDNELVGAVSELCLRARAVIPTLRRADQTLHDWALTIPPAYSDTAKHQAKYLHAAREAVNFYDWIVRACHDLRQELIAGYPPAADMEPVY
jgi:hypothetical protein